ncbi:MAG TPA: hypothetical protein VL337_02570 [Acidimicrobiales bacterium]|jgi:hypothetical protein|nr:hypothetical protein [Acidimicrobiales bacterium]
MSDVVLRALGDQAVATGHRMIDHVALKQSMEDVGIPDDEWFGALVELRAQKLVQMRDYDGKVALLQLTQPGLWAYATRFRPDLADVTERLLDILDTAEANVSMALGADLGVPPLLVEAVLDHLAGRDLVVFSRLGADSFRIHRFSG